MENQLISVIIPMYNAEKYMEDCLQSVQSQTYTNFECIVVDDESKDNSRDIVRKYAEQDPRIRLVCKEHAGVSYAISCGVQNAKGTWLYFLDSDDWIDPDELERLYRAVKEHSCDMVASDHMTESKHTERRYIVRFQGRITKEEYEQKLYDQFMCNKSHNEVVCGNHRGGKLIKRELVTRNLSLQEGMVFAEDSILVLSVLFDCDAIYAELSKAGYHYRVHGDSSVHNYGTAYARHKRTYVERTWRMYEEKGVANNKILQENFVKFQLYSVVAALKTVNFQMNVLKENDPEVYQWIQEVIADLRNKKGLGLRDHVIVWMLSHDVYQVISFMYWVNRSIVYKLIK